MTRSPEPVPTHSRFGYLLLQLLLRDLRTRYSQTLLGALWGLGRPLIELGVYAIVFGGFLKAPTDGVPYALFAYFGVVLWTLVSGGLPRGARSVSAHAGLVSRTPFPKATLPLAALGAAGVDALIAGTILVVLLIHYGVALTPAALWLLPVIAILLVLLTGVTLLASALHVFYHDLGHAVDLGVRVLQLLTPVAYASSAVPARYRSLYDLNPLAPIFDAARSALLLGRAPDPATLVYPLVIAVGFLMAGTLVFRTMEPFFAEAV
jgi:lipopolysaccharide transport system permease protein